MKVLRSELQAALAAIQAGEAVPPYLAALARVHAGEVLSDAAEVRALFEAAPVDVLPLLYRACAASVEVVRLVLELVRTDALAEDREGLLLALAARQLPDGPTKRKLAALVRRSLLRVADVPAMISMSYAAKELGTPAVLAAQKTLSEWVIPEDLKRLGHELDEKLSLPVLDALPERDDEVLITGFTARRASEKIGRNDPCPCGSGKKYKKCCEGRDEARGLELSPVAGMTRSEWLAKGQLDAKSVQRLSPDELALVPPAALGADALAELVLRAASFRRWALVEVGWPLVLTKGSVEVRRSVRDRVLLDCAQTGEIQLADRILQDSGDDVPYDLELSLNLCHERRAGGLLADVEADVADMLREGADDALQDLAYAFLDQFPALGILVGRGALSTRVEGDSESLLYTIEDARALLDLPEGDPGWRMLSRRREAEDASARKERERRVVEARDREAEETVRKSAMAARERAEALEARLRDAERSLAAARAAEIRGSGASPEDAEARRRLEGKVSELKGLVAEGNRERADLRQKLSDIEVRARRDEPVEAADEIATDVDDDAEPGGIDAPRGLQIPVFSDDAQKQLQRHPRHVAADALARAAQLGAGDGWSGVKQMQDIEPPLYSARLGIHHRMLFRTGEGRLHVLEVLQREGLDAALKRYRR